MIFKKSLQSQNIMNHYHHPSFYSSNLNCSSILILTIFAVISINYFWNVLKTVNSHHHPYHLCLYPLFLDHCTDLVCRSSWHLALLMLLHQHRRWFPCSKCFGIFVDFLFIHLFGSSTQLHAFNNHLCQNGCACSCICNGKLEDLIDLLLVWIYTLLSAIGDEGQALCELYQRGIPQIYHFLIAFFYLRLSFLMFNIIK